MGDKILDVERQRFGVFRYASKLVTEAAERAAEIGGAGAGADKMRYQETWRLWAWGTGSRGERPAELGKEGRFAGAGVAGEDEEVRSRRRGIGLGEGEHLAEQRLATADDVALGALLDEGFHLLR